jgi:hypothetical protein
MAWTRGILHYPIAALHYQTDYLLFLQFIRLGDQTHFTGGCELPFLLEHH